MTATQSVPPRDEAEAIAVLAEVIAVYRNIGTFDAAPLYAAGWLRSPEETV